MDIDDVAFYGRLLGVLEAIAHADFVALDLEFSGIPGRLQHSSRLHTLQTRYANVKEAAEKNTVFQVGLTCMTKDPAQGCYIARPYNFDISPRVDSDILIDRKFSVSSGTLEFIIKHGFNIDRVFNRGVRYLSRDEAKEAEINALSKTDLSNRKQIELTDEDTEAVAFVEQVRQKIDHWLNGESQEPKDAYLNIGTGTPNETHPQTPAELTQYQKRLVYELVDREHANSLTACGRRTFIQIRRYDAVADAASHDKAKRMLDNKINQKTGFRWVVEALIGGSLTGLDPKYFTRSPSGAPVACDMNEIFLRFKSVQETLTNRRPVLVGHNLFTDLTYFYACFLGKLPATVREFKDTVHRVFPYIIDTKYLATSGGQDMSSNSSLAQVAERMASQGSPKIMLHEDHEGYSNVKRYHEAGYDSHVTATILIKLSASLSAAGTAPAPTDTRSDCSDAMTYATAPERLYEPSFSTGSTTFLSALGAPGLAGTALIHPGAVPPTTQKKKKNRRRKRGRDVGGEQGWSRFADPNPFEVLQGGPRGVAGPHSATTSLTPRLLDSLQRGLGATTSPHPEGRVEGWLVRQKKKTSPRPAAAEVVSPATETGQTSPQLDAPHHPQQDQKKSALAMPAFDTSFWRMYGNKLRIYGTNETELDLGEWSFGRGDY